MTGEAISVVVVDDHPLYREGVVRTLEEDGGFAVLAQGASAADAVRLTETLSPDVVLLDISMPGGGHAALADISGRYPDVAVVMLTMSEIDDDVIRAMEGGARGFVPKGVGGDELTAILRQVAAGEAYVSPALAGRLLSRIRHGQAWRKSAGPAELLTTREEEILQLVAEGLSNKEIGRKLDLQEKTIKHYMTNILQKLNVRNRVEAAIKARERSDLG